MRIVSGVWMLSTKRGDALDYNHSGMRESSAKMPAQVSAEALRPNFSN